MATNPVSNLCALAVGLTALLTGSGCSSPQGLLWTHTVTPYDLPADRSATGRGGKHCSIDITELRDPVTRAHLSVIWTNRLVMDTAARAGMKDIRYADLETLSILNGTYKRERLIFYGD